VRKAIPSLSIIACLATNGVAMAQAGATPAAGTPQIRACALLTRELVTQFGANANAKLLDLIPPQEEQVGAGGSGCEYGGIYLQIDPFGRGAQLRKAPAQDWLAVSGVGETAYFHNNRNHYAELMVWSGAHHFTIQMSVPSGATAESIKPKTIGLANALIPQLR
jgi:hypothetical protein